MVSGSVLGRQQHGARSAVNAATCSSSRRVAMRVSCLSTSRSSSCPGRGMHYISRNTTTSSSSTGLSYSVVPTSHQSLHKHKIPSVIAAAAATNVSISPIPATQQQPAVAIPALAPTAAAAASAAAVAYDAEYTADMWSRRPVPVVARLLEVCAAFGGWWIRAALHKDTTRAAADMRTVLVNLGPAFVKIGQALSSRPDVLPPEYLKELELLQDRIPPFRDEDALQVIEEEVGLPWRSVFTSLSSSPVAAASLGQVYRGRLVGSGADVAVKVQRPGVVDAIGRDTFILRHLAGLARQQLKLNTDLPALVDEWAASLFKELDYRREAANGIRFAELFSFMPEVAVPHMYTELTAPRVLVMEWIDGDRLRTASQQAPAAAAASPVAAAAAGSSRAGLSAAEVANDLRLVEIGVRCSLEQMLEEGFYHADPHPGNLLKTADGRLAYLDFGMMGEIDPAVRQALIRATLHMVNREYARLAEDFVVLGLLPQGADLDEVIPALTDVFQKALSGGVSNLSFTTLSSDLARTMYKYSLRIPPYYTLLVRSLSVLEGIALASDPNYKVLGAAYPWVSRRLLTQNSPELHATLNQLLYDNDGRFKFSRMESLLEQAAKAAVAPIAASSTAAAAAAAAGSTIGSNGAAASNSNGVTAVTPVNNTVISGFFQPIQILTQPAGRLLGTFIPGFGSSSSNGAAAGQQQQYSGRASEAATAGGPFALLLSPEGGYIRGILENELAKGLDAAWRLAVDQTLDNATHQIEGLVSASPVLLPLLTQRQQQQQPYGGSSSRMDLLQTLVSIPKLADAEDRTQVEGLSKLARQLAAFSTVKQQAKQALGSSNSAILAQPPPQLQQQQQVALSDQIQQTAVVFNWLSSEVQLLSPAARREALKIPINILSKLAGRLAARAVRAMLTPSTAARYPAAYPAGSSDRVLSARTRPSPDTSSSSSSSSAMLAAAAPMPAAAPAASDALSSSNGVPPKVQPVTGRAVQQQRWQQQVQGKKPPKSPAQRQLIYDPDIQPLPPTQQQQLSVTPSAAAAMPAQSPIVQYGAAGTNGSRRSAASGVTQQQQQQQQRLSAGEGVPSASKNGGSLAPASPDNKPQLVQQQQHLDAGVSPRNGNGRSNGYVRSSGSSSSTNNGHNRGSSGSSDMGYVPTSSATRSSSLGSSSNAPGSSSNGWIDEVEESVVIVEAHAVLEPVDVLVRPERH